MGYLPATVFTIGVLAIVILGCWLCLKADAIVNWLKGSRKLYTLRHNFLYECMWEDLCWAGNIIEVVLRPFFPKAILHGKASKDWIVNKVSLGLDANLKFGAGRVNLADRNNLSVEQALHVANNYSSLRAMLDRIVDLERHNAELQDKLETVNQQRIFWWARVKAILEIIKDDRQLYRSKAAGNIRRCLEAVDREVQCSKEEASPPGSAVARQRVAFEGILGMLDEES